MWFRQLDLPIPRPARPAGVVEKPHTSLSLFSVSQ
jgi:hypothetical protein